MAEDSFPFAKHIVFCDTDIGRPKYLKAGDDFAVNINYTGFPTPTAQFWNNDTLLSNDSRVFIKITEEVTEEFVSIIVKKAVREDAGHYRLRLTNDAGYDTATFKVRLFSKSRILDHTQSSIYSSNLRLKSIMSLIFGTLELRGEIIRKFDRSHDHIF